MTDNILIFISVVVLAVVFALLVAVITLRFLNVLNQMKQSDSRDRVELMRELDQSHVQAFSNAMTALGDIQSRVYESNMAMFNRTMDMVHGPATPPDQTTTFAVDDPTLDNRPAWAPDDDGDGIEQMIDHTDDDEWLGLAGDISHDDMNGRAVSVRPGETLVPGQ